MAFTEFCCRSGGSNLNAGTRTGNSTVPGTSADFTYASGNWVQSTGVFTVASGNPQSDGVAVGDFASVYEDGSTVTGFVGRVTARDATTITVSLSAKAGTAPTNGTGNRTLKIGGAWKGPNGAEAFPFAFIANTLTNSSSNLPRVNLMNDAAYNITAMMDHNTTPGVTFEGFSTSYGDKGSATIAGPATGSAIILLRINGNSIGTGLSYLIFDGNGDSGSEPLVRAFRFGGIYRGCVFKNSRGSGAHNQFADLGGLWIECEFYDNLGPGFTLDTGQNRFIRCSFHDNADAGCSASTTVYFESCQFFNNSSNGVFQVNAPLIVKNCDFYENGSDGIFTGAGGTLYVENCNFIKNGGYGVELFNGQPNGNGGTAMLINCGFGTGTMANTSGQHNLTGASIVEGSVTYDADVTPWVDPDNGDFRINLAAAKNAGRGTFTFTDSGYSSAANTVGYPDIGAAQHQETVSNTGGFSVFGVSFRTGGRM